MRFLLPLTVLAALGWTGSVAGQVEITGRVIDNETLAPISGVDIRLSYSRLEWKVTDRAFTDEQGRFAFTAEEGGGYIFRAKRIGYEDVETPILWTDTFSDYQLEIRLDPDAVLVAPIEVLARAKGDDSPVLAEFQHRVESGFGHYITYQDIQQLKPGRVTDLLARVPGLRLESSGTGLRRDVYMRGGHGLTRCKAQIFVDGMLWSRRLPGEAQSAYTVDDAILPADVFGIEVYTGLATIPAQYLTPGSRCGVVAIWTRR